MRRLPPRSILFPYTTLFRSLSDEEAVFTEPLAAAFEILEQVQVNLGDEVLVLGDGKLSFLCAQVLRQTSANVTLVGKHRSEEHTSELQSLRQLVCRLLLEKK